MRFRSPIWLDIFKPDSLKSLSGKIMWSQNDMWKMASETRICVRPAPTVLPELPVEVIAVIGEHLAIRQHLATLANLNVSCKAVHWETMPILWRIFRANDFGVATGLRFRSTRDYELHFSEQFGHLEGYKYMQYATASPGMLKIDDHSQLPYSRRGRPGEIPPCRVTILSSLSWPLDDDIDIIIEASILHLSISQKLFCPKMLQLFDGGEGGVIHCPYSQLESPLTQFPKLQCLLVTVPSVHSDFGYASMVKKNLEIFLDNSIPAPKPRFDLVEIIIHQRESTPIDPDYLYALIADMNDLLAHSVGLDLLQTLPTSDWVELRIDVDDDAQIHVIFAAWSRIAFHAPYRGSIKLALQVDRRERTLRERQRWFQPFKAECTRHQSSVATAPRFHVEVTIDDSEECIAALVPRRNLEAKGWNQGNVNLDAQCLCIPNDGDEGDYLTTDFWNPETEL